MKFRCLIRKHVWIVGRAASDVARHLVKGKKSYHNRTCCYCGKEEWNADDAEAEAERILSVRELLGKTRKAARIEAMDPKLRPIDPDAFP